MSCKSVLVVLCGNILRFYYVFEFGWTIAGSCLFWGRGMGLPEKNYVYCEGSPFKGYVYFLLIFTYLIIPVNLYIAGFRSKYEFAGEETLATETARRATELIEKHENSV